MKSEVSPVVDPLRPPPATARRARAPIPVELGLRRRRRGDGVGVEAEAPLGRREGAALGDLVALDHRADGGDRCKSTVSVLYGGRVHYDALRIHGGAGD